MYKSSVLSPHSRFSRVRTVLHALIIAALLAGVIPPSLVASAIRGALPARVAEPLAEAAEALLPDESVAFAQDSWLVDFAFTPIPDLTLTKTASPDTASSSDVVTYTITVGNPSSVTALDIVVRDQLPAGVTYSAHVASSGVYDPVDGAWRIPTLAPGTETLTITVIVE